jgi:hypothetical protein
VSYGQLIRRDFSELRQPGGSEPCFDIQLEDHEKVVGVFHSWTVESASRKTVDHHITLWVLAEFSPAEPGGVR